MNKSELKIGMRISTVTAPDIVLEVLYISPNGNPLVKDTRDSGKEFLISSEAVLKHYSVAKKKRSAWINIWRNSYGQCHTGTKTHASKQDARLDSVKWYGVGPSTYVDTIEINWLE